MFVAHNNDLGSLKIIYTPPHPRPRKKFVLIIYVYDEIVLSRVHMSKNVKAQSKCKRRQTFATKNMLYFEYVYVGSSLLGYFQNQAKFWLQHVNYCVYTQSGQQFEKSKEKSQRQTAYDLVAGWLLATNSSTIKFNLLSDLSRMFCIQFIISYTSMLLAFLMQLTKRSASHTHSYGINTALIQTNCTFYYCVHYFQMK